MRPVPNHSSDQLPVRFGLAGIGGYGWVIAQTLHGRPDLATFSTACEPDAKRRAERAGELGQWNTVLHEQFAQMLREDTEAVWLPLPIGLHSQFLIEALAHGKAVMCEKPAAATVQEVDEMIAARDRTPLPAFIAYQHLSDPAILQLKHRLLAKELGTIHAVRVVGCWPRPMTYYTRNDWAGRLKANGRWVLDSPLSNAMSHYLQLALFLIGPTAYTSSQAAEVEAELYRANPIENFDTCSIRVRTEEKIDLLALMTHACEKAIDPAIEIIGSAGSVIVRPEHEIQWRGTGGSETIPLSKQPRDRLLEAFCRHLRKQPAEAALASLEIARAPIVVVNCVAEAAAPVDVPSQSQPLVGSSTDDVINVIPGIESIFRRCAAEGKMIHESGQVSWSVPAKSKSAAGYRKFNSPANV